MVAADRGTMQSRECLSKVVMAARIGLSTARWSTNARFVVAVAVLGWWPILVGYHLALAQVGPSASARMVLPSELLVLAQADPARPGVATPAPRQPIGLPRVRDYEPIPQLRDIYFDFGAAVIRPDDVTTLNANAAWLRAHPSHLVLVEGHCDSQGATSTKSELNMDLGERRAEAAMKYLIAQGVHPSRITVLSYGEERPQCTEASERCWSQNRRSRFLVKPR
jgi:peptidoglycan-associated lipoprotein